MTWFALMLARRHRHLLISKIAVSALPSIPHSVWPQTALGVWKARWPVRADDDTSPQLNLGLINDMERPETRPQVQAQALPSLDLRQRVIAATGASVLSALVVNPLDVIKVRMQAQASGTTGAAPMQSYQAYCFHRSIPVRSMLQSHMVSSTQAARSLALQVSEGLSRLSPSPSQPSPPRSAWPSPKLASMSASPCVCAASAGGMATLGLDALHELQAPPACPQPTRSVTPGMLPTLRQIVRQEGLSSLWRGLDSALLMSVPTVLLYYPLYDSLLASLSADTHDAPRLGLAAPVIAGAAARTVTVFAVAPLEFVRVRQQAGGAGGGAAATPQVSLLGATSLAATASSSSSSTSQSTWQALRSSLVDVAAPVGAEAAGGSGAALLRALPRLWTGLSATIARDVPFSAIYWGLVEPIRGTLLSSQRAPLTPAATPEALGGGGLITPADLLPDPTLPSTTCHTSSSPTSSGDSNSSHTSSGDSSSSSSHAVGGDTSSHTSSSHTHVMEVDDWSVPAASLQQATPLPVLAAAPQPPQPAQPDQQAGPSHTQLVVANLIAGSLAGATASAATTPFDVVKTRMQLGPAGQPVGSMVHVMREVVQQQGVRGLFVGVWPRAARCAPACAIVIACYEVLKSVLGAQQPQQQAA